MPAFGSDSWVRYAERPRGEQASFLSCSLNSWQARPLPKWQPTTSADSASVSKAPEIRACMVQLGAGIFTLHSCLFLSLDHKGQLILGAKSKASISWRKGGCIKLNRVVNKAVRTTLCAVYMSCSLYVCLLSDTCQNPLSGQSWPEAWHRTKLVTITVHNIHHP